MRSSLNEVDSRSQLVDLFSMLLNLNTVVGDVCWHSLQQMPVRLRPHVTSQLKEVNQTVETLWMEAGQAQLLHGKVDGLKNLILGPLDFDDLFQSKYEASVVS